MSPRPRNILVVGSSVTHQSFAPMAMGDSGTSTVLTRYESMRLRSLCQSERTTARDLVQHNRWIYPCYRTVSTEHKQRWMRWWCTAPSNHLEKVIDMAGLYVEGSVPLWMKPCQEYWTVAITFHTALVYIKQGWPTQNIPRATRDVDNLDRTTHSMIARKDKVNNYIAM